MNRDNVGEEQDDSKAVPPRQLQEKLGSKATSGALYIGSAQAASALLSILSTIVVARLLTPGDYGVMAMVAPITGFILIFQNLGLNQAIIQAKSLSDKHVNALFWVTLAASFVIALIFLALSPVVSWFYADPRAGELTAASAATTLLSGTALQHTSLLNRNLRFKALCLVDISKAVAGFLATAAFAYFVRTYWALWMGAFVGVAVNVLMVWIMDPWRPSRKISLKGTRKMLTFGANVTGFTLLNYLSRNVDNVLIAKAWGAGAVGLYDRSYRLMMFPLQNINLPLGRVMLPILGRLSDEAQRYRQAFLLALRAISLISMPGVAVAAITSDRLVPFLLGARWAEASPIFFWLSLAALTQPIGNATGWLFLSTGRSGAMLKWGFFSSSTTVAAFCVGLPWGAKGVAQAYFCAQSMQTLILYWWSTRGTPVTQGDLYAVALPSLAGGAVAWGVSRHLTANIPFGYELLLLIATAYSASLLCHAATATGREAIKTIWQRTAGTLARRSRRRTHGE